jgi:DNA-binding transcriptional regulator GbsR (MarR family)
MSKLTPPMQKFILHWGEMGSSWGINRTVAQIYAMLVHILGDRRDHFETMNDIWEMFRVILDERKRREFDPTLNVLRETVGELANGEYNSPFAMEKVAEMLDLFETITIAYNQIEKMPTDAIKKMATLGDGLAKILGLVTQEKIPGV